jgi:hypothetical protein
MSYQKRIDELCNEIINSDDVFEQVGRDVVDLVTETLQSRMQPTKVHVKWMTTPDDDYELHVHIEDDCVDGARLVFYGDPNTIALCFARTAGLFILADDYPTGKPWC